MTDDRAVNEAFEAFLDALASGPWRARPADADPAVQRRLQDLRTAARRIDPAHWPRQVATLLRRPADHHESNPHPPDNVVALPEPEDDG